jgi:homoserine dehydrogenase
MNTIDVGLIGLGTVGSGVYTLLRRHQKELEFQVEAEINIKKILVKQVNKERIVDGETIPSSKLTDSFTDLLEDESIQIIIEVMGGDLVAHTYIEQALKAGKTVITANKDVLALHGKELNTLAVENKCDLFYEASVGGGIPIIRSLVEGLASDKISKIMGIVNGTTNYILTKMSLEDMDYMDALNEAQKLGFAEPDPTGDVEGLDAARKMVILASLGFSMPIELKDVYTHGISQVSITDIQFAKSLGYVIKLIGLAQMNEGEVEVSVQPTFLPKEHPLASVNNENNAVYLCGEAVGQTMFFGPGAGSLPTATAIVSDLITAIKRLQLGIRGNHLFAYNKEPKIKSEDKIMAKFYLRLTVEDQIGVLNQITSIFAKEQLSFESVVQKPTKKPLDAQLIIITHEVVLSNYLKALRQLKQLEHIKHIDSSYRVVSIQ